MNSDKELAKELKQQIAAHQNRLEAIQSDIERLKVVKGGLEKEINDKRAAYTKEYEDKMFELRKYADKISADRNAVEGDRAALAEDRRQYVLDKSALDQARNKAEATIKNYEDMTTNIGKFVRLVKKEAESL